MIHRCVVTGPLGVNCYIVGCEETKKAAVIDPGGDVDKITADLDEAGLSPICILLTHGHWDHIGAAGELKSQYGCPIHLHKEDETLYQQAPVYAEFFGFTVAEPLPIDNFYKDGQAVNVGKQSVRVVHTPGHSEGSVSLYAENGIYAGDLIFAGGVGRTDLPGGSFEALQCSIHQKILTFPDETPIFPGHGPSTTVREERRNLGTWNGR